MQNKPHWAIPGQTAAEVIVDPADATKEHMGLHTWTDAPLGKIQKFDTDLADRRAGTDPELADGGIRVELVAVAARRGHSRAALAAGERLPRRGRGHGAP